MWGLGECYDVKRACSSKPGEERGRLRRGLRLTFYSEAQGNVLNFCSGWHVRFSRAHSNFCSTCMPFFKLRRHGFILLYLLKVVSIRKRFWHCVYTFCNNLILTVYIHVVQMYCTLRFLYTLCIV